MLTQPLFKTEFFVNFRRFSCGRSWWRYKFATFIITPGQYNNCSNHYGSISYISQNGRRYKEEELQIIENSKPNEDLSGIIFISK